MVLHQCPASVSLTCKRWLIGAGAGSFSGVRESSERRFHMKLDERIVQGVWEKARAVDGKDPTEWRKDECGAWIRHDHYDSKQSEFGWKIENVSPGGPDTVENLRPFQRDNSFDIAEDKPHCRITADREDIPPTASIDSPQNKAVED